MKVNMDTNMLYFTDHLLKKLSSMLHKKLTIIEAPMGYGKTVAVREFLQGKPVDTVWINLSQSTEADLWEFFCQSFETQLPQYAETVQKMRALGLPEGESAIKNCIKLLREADFPRATFFILDDYQLANTVRMSLLVEALTRIGCPNAYVVLISRDLYCGTAGMMNLKGNLAYLAQEDFVLNKADIMAYYNLCGVTLSQSEADLLVRDTDGWIGALYFYLIRYQREGKLSFPTKLYELMDLEFFSQRSEEAQQFLYAVFPLQTFSFEQADYVWGKGNTREILTGLRFQNPFVLYDDHTGCFYLHTVLARFLGRRVERLEEDVKAQIYARCGDWFLQQNDYLRAMQYYFQAKQFDQLLSVLTLDQGDSITLERWPFFCDVLKNCPKEIAARQVMAIFFLTIAALLVGDGELYEQYTDFLQSCFNNTPEEDATHKKLAEILAFVCCLRFYNDLDAMTRRLCEAEPLAHTLSLYTPKGPTLTMGMPSLLLPFHRMSGRLREELEQLKAFLPAFERVTGGVGAGCVELMEAEMLFHEGKIKDAEIISHAAEVIALSQQRPSNVCCALFLQIRCAVLSGNDKMGERLLKNMETYAQNDITEGKLIFKMFELSRAFLDAFAGRMEPIPDWIRTGQDMQKHIYLFAYPMFQIIYGRCLLQEKNYTRLAGYFQGLLGDARYSQYILFTIYARIYIAAAQYSMGWSSQAYQTLTEAMEEALPDRIYMPFAENFVEIQPLLEQVRVRKPYLQQEITTIFLLSGQLKTYIGRATTNGRKQRTGLLTKREREMARLACAGKTNVEIASELFLAESTVKRAMVDIFRKLGIHSRKELSQHKDQFVDEVS